MIHLATRWMKIHSVPEAGEDQVGNQVEVA